MSEFFYSVPFDTKRHPLTITQGRHGPWSHRRFDKNDMANAVDFGLPPGTPALAAREGIVAAVIDWNHTFYTGEDPIIGLDPILTATNFVIVAHEDGTSAVYSHLKRNGSLVQPDDLVEAGQPLALTGLSGWVGDTPHLHFHVYDGTFRSLPVRFKNYSGALRHVDLYPQIPTPGIEPSFYVYGS